MSLQNGSDAGGLSLGDRLTRIENSLQELSEKVDKVLWWVAAITGAGAAGGIGLNVLPHIAPPH